MTNEEIVKALQAKFDNSLFEKLLQNNKPLIKRCLLPYNSALPPEDLLQAAHIGIWQAIEKYDPSQNVAFMTFAKHYIQLNVTREIINGGNNIKLPPDVYWRLNKYRRFISSFKSLNGRSPSLREIRAGLKISEAQAETLELCDQMQKTCSLSAGIWEEGGTLEDAIPAPEDAFEDIEQRADFEEMAKELWAAVDSLPQEQAALIRAKFQQGETASEIMQEMNISRGQAERFAKKAYGTLKRHTPKCKSYHEVYLSAGQTRHVGVSSFLRTWTSEVEWEALRTLGLED